MEGRALLQLLLDQKSLSGNGLATALKGAVSQSSIQKYLTGTAREPRRSTLQAFADYFGVPVEAFYDESAANKVAYQLGAQAGRDTVVAQVSDAGVSSPPIPLPPQPQNLRDSFRRMRSALAVETPGVRRSVVALLGDLAEKAEDVEFSERIIDRIMAVLGSPEGKPVPRESTSFQRGGSK